MSNPVNTALCIDTVGTFCADNADIVTTAALESSDSNVVTGLGSPSVPYKVDVIVDPDVTNALELTASGLYVSNSVATDYTFSNTGFVI